VVSFGLARAELLGAEQKTETGEKPTKKYAMMTAEESFSRIQVIEKRITLQDTIFTGWDSNHSWLNPSGFSNNRGDGAAI